VIPLSSFTALISVVIGFHPDFFHEVCPSILP
jgi:hypothetical protein